MDMVRSKHIVVSIVHDTDWRYIQIVNLTMDLDINLAHPLWQVIAYLRLVALLAIGAGLI